MIFHHVLDDNMIKDLDVSCISYFRAFIRYKDGHTKVVDSLESIHYFKSSDVLVFTFIFDCTGSIERLTYKTHTKRIESITFSQEVIL